MGSWQRQLAVQRRTMGYGPTRTVRTYVGVHHSWQPLSSRVAELFS